MSCTLWFRRFGFKIQGEARSEPFALSFSLGELRLLRAALEGVLCRLMRLRFRVRAYALQFGILDFGRLLMRGGPDLSVLFVLFGRL